jgi:CubicO group peptidase (beta-lactamase class C family)
VIGAPSGEELRERLETELERDGVPGAAALVVEGGAVRLRACVGVADRRTGVPVDEMTGFCLGSCSKAVTAAVVGTLVADGVLDWNLPVRRWVPELAFEDPVRTAETTLRDLLSHRSGMSRDSVYEWACDLGHAHVAAHVREIGAVAPFRDRWSYWNVGYYVAALAAERAAGRPFAALVEDRLARPLDAALVVDEAGARRFASLAAPHGPASGDGALRRYPPLPLDAAVGSGSVTASLTGMERWLSAWLGVAPWALPAPLRQELLAVQARIAAPEDSLPGSAAHAAALGWELQTAGGELVAAHSGRFLGTAARVVLLPAAGSAAVVMANAEGPAPRAFLAWWLGRRAGAREDWGQRARRSNLTDPRMATGPFAPSSVAGAYRRPGWRSLAVTAGDGGWRWAMDRAPLLDAAIAECEGRLRVTFDHPAVDAQLGGPMAADDTGLNTPMGRFVREG